MTGMGWMELMVGVLGGGGLGALVTGWFDRRRVAAESRQTDAEAEVTLSGGYGELVAELRAERKELREQIVQSHTDNQTLLAEIVASRSETIAARSETAAARQEVAELRRELGAVKADLRRVLNGEQPLGNWD